THRDPSFPPSSGSFEELDRLSAAPEVDVLEGPVGPDGGAPDGLRVVVVRGREPGRGPDAEAQVGQVLDALDDRVGGEGPGVVQEGGDEDSRVDVALEGGEGRLLLGAGDEVPVR